MKSNGDEVYIKVVMLSEICNFIVDKFFYKKYLEHGRFSNSKFGMSKVI
jgi:hypothetical protein